MMTRAKFLALVPFMYTGHFQRMKRYPLVYCKTGTWEQKMSVHDATDQVWWSCIECTEEGFSVWSKGFGKINILFSECKEIESKN